MAGGSAPQVQETEEEKAQAQVAQAMWDMYTQELEPYEDVFISDVNKMNDPAAYTKAAGDTNLSYASQFGDSRDQANNSLASAGVNPNSGKFGTTQNSLTRQQVFSQNDATNRAQSSEADKYVGGLQDALAIGAGESAQNMGSIDDIASASARSAKQDAQVAESNSLSDMSTLGSLTGAATAGITGGLMRSKRSSPGLSSLSSGGTGAMGMGTNFNDYT